MHKGETFEEDEGVFKGGGGRFQARRGFFEGWPSFRVRRMGGWRRYREEDEGGKKKRQRKMWKKENLGVFNHDYF